MRGFCLILVLVIVGCRNCQLDVPLDVEMHVMAVASTPATADISPLPAATAEPPWTGAVDLPTLWNLALANNPALRETGAELEVARGKWIQASKYPNPRIAYEQEELGTSRNSSGALRLEVTQEIVTGWPWVGQAREFGPH